MQGGIPGLPGGDISPLRAGVKGGLIGQQQNEGGLTEGEMTLPNPKSASSKQ